MPSMMPQTRRHPLLPWLAAALLLASGSSMAQTYWQARKLVAEINAPVIVGKDKNGEVIDRFQRAWVVRTIAVLDRMAPAYGFEAPTLYINKDKSPNAFVTLVKEQPVMVVNTDMLRLAGDSDELMATVIGHELGHLKGQHLTKGAQSAAAVSILGALLGAAVDIGMAHKGKETFGLGGLAGSLGAGLITSKFSRDQERDADRMGVEAMAKAGFDPAGAPRLWQLMGRNSGSAGLWMDSHPSHAEREQTLSAMAQSLQPVYAANRPPPRTLPSYPDPWPSPRYASLEPTPDDVATQSAYEQGRTAFKDKRYADAVAPLSEAAEAGDERAMTLLAGMRQNGQGGLAVDLGAARDYYEQAAAKGFAPAIAGLGFMAFSGKGLPKDPAEAMRYFVLADSRGHARATSVLGLMVWEGNGVPKDERLARELAERAERNNDLLGRALLGTLLRDGIGGSADPARGFALLRAAAPEVAWGSYQLGVAYERGNGTPADKDKAIEAYRRASAGGIGAAEARLKRLAPP